MKVTLDEKGRITIPLEIRKKMEIEPGEKINLSLVNKILLLRKTITVSEFERLSENIRNSIIEKTDNPIEFEKLF